MQTLILGPGPHHVKQPGETLLDVRPFPGVDILHNLDVVPWPVLNEAFTRVVAVHVVEHLRSLLAFMDEAWRILQPGGSLYLETPLAGADPDLEFADPTHVRCYRVHTFWNYFSPEGVQAFGYTGRAWNLFHLQARELHAGKGDYCIFVHASPIKL